VLLPAHPESVRDGASRQLKFISHSVPIHPRLQTGLSQHILSNDTCSRQTAAAVANMFQIIILCVSSPVTVFVPTELPQ
jgi:hypothetical protein